MFRPFMLGMSNSKIRITFKLVVLYWMKFKLTSQSQLLSLCSFLSLHWSVLFIVSKTKSPQPIHKKMNPVDHHHQTAWSPIFLSANKKEMNELQSQNLYISSLKYSLISFPTKISYILFFKSYFLIKTIENYFFK